ncbi:MAG: hypothetical protein IH600_09020 [Bacteroidetes bacterium]|nr:hypothetical protein [Bacteroidota bacterium]
MDKKDKKSLQHPVQAPGREIEFCLNCNDMEDLAISDEAKNLEQLHRRFDNCRENGKFQGDVCARIFVAEDRIDEPAFFADEDEDL